MRHTFYYISILLFFIYSCKKEEKIIEEPQLSKFNPDSAIFVKERPSPSIVRGFMMNEKFNQTDCLDARNWGANVIRMQLFPADYAKEQNKGFWEIWPIYLDQMEVRVKYAKQAGLKVIIDLHRFPYIVDNVETLRTSLYWNREDLGTILCKVWTDIAKRFLPYKETIWGYDLLNEPVDNSQLPSPPWQWRPLAIKVIESIRVIDPDVWIIYETGPSGLFSGFKDLKPLPDKHVIYSAHFYYPGEFTHQGFENRPFNLSYPGIVSGARWNKDKLYECINATKEFQDRWKVPIFVGEFSVVRWAPKESAITYLKDVIDIFEERGWSWCYHAFREWHGWSLEHDDQFWNSGMPAPLPVNYETERAKVVKEALKRN